MSGEHGFEVPTTPIAPDRDRRPWLVVVLLASLVGAAIALARWTSEPDQARVALTPGPTVAVAEVLPLATPLPALHWFTGPEAPLDDILVEAGQIRRLRLASARLDDGVLAEPGRDLLLPAERGGTTCLCWQAAGPDPGDFRRLDLVRRDRNDQELSRTTITTIDGPALSEGDQASTQVALEPSPDGRFVYLARSVLDASQLRVALDVIDLQADAIVDTVGLVAEVPDEPASTPATEPPALRAAPDGRHLLLAVERDRLIPPSATARAWLIGLDDGRLGEAVEADAVVDGQGAPCAWIDFATDDLIAQGCRAWPGDDSAGFEIRRFGLDGHDLGAIQVGAWRSAIGAPLIDTSTGMLYAWDPVARRLHAIDVVRGTRATAGSSGVADPTVTESTDPGLAAGSPVIWSDGLAATATRGDRTSVGSPDGRRILVIRDAFEEGESSEVLVYETPALRLVERWPALAAYASLALLEDGRWLAAIGRPGLTADGRPAAWGTSLTIHDTTDGHAILRLGDIAADTRVTFAQTGVVGAQ